MTINKKTGPLLWMLSLQYFVIQLIVMHSFKSGFNLRSNTISDLGNTFCGLYDGRPVCSPLHPLMNASFILLGITMFLGAIYVYRLFKPSRLSCLGFGALALAGFGTLLVGAFPENTVSAFHVFGAAMPFLIGNIGMVLLSFSLNIPRPLRVYTLISGSVALLALVLLMTHSYFGIGIGGMERLTAYPQTLWLIIFGLYFYFKKEASRLNTSHFLEEPFSLKKASKRT